MKNWMILFITGIISIVVGIAALFNPFAASLAVETLIGYTFIIIGVLLIVTAFTADKWGGKLWTGLLGAIALFLGVVLIANPLKGIITLAILAAILFLVSGVIKIIVGLRVHDKMLKLAVLLSGAVSVILALMIFSDFPESGAVILGILFAVEMISIGVSSISLALARKSGGVKSQ